MSTRTTKFGVSKRESHDSSKFYDSKLYKNKIKTETKDYEGIELPNNQLNKIYCKDARNMSFLPDNCLHLMVTSPPYNVGKEYDNDLSLEEYLLFIEDVMKEVYRVLVPGGRACINVANLGRKPYIPLNGYITKTMIDIGFLMRGEIIWNKAASSGTSTAWGCWCSAANPVLRDVHEYIMVFSKETFSRPNDKKTNRENTIQKSEFLDFTKSVWTFNTESAKRVNHPAPFPVELPYRFLQLYTFKNDIVLDPFCGSGTTCIAALQSNRKYIGIDIDKDYIATALTRIENYTELGEDIIKLTKQQQQLKNQKPLF